MSADNRDELTVTLADVLKRSKAAEKMSRSEIVSAVSAYDDIRVEHRHSNLNVILRAASLYAERLPATKMVLVWRVEWWHDQPWARHFTTEEAANEYANDTRTWAFCVNVSGPHEQEVPA